MMEPLDGEIWEDAEGSLMIWDAKRNGWWAFAYDQLVPEDDPIILHPLRLVFDGHGYLQVREGFRLRYPKGNARTTFTFTVLHRTDEPFQDGLREAMDRSMYGHSVGWETGEETVEVPDEEVRSELIALANDGEFFDADLEEE